METGEILIIKLSSIGDVVHTLPSLDALNHLYPHANITWLVEEDASSLLEGHPYLSRVIVSRRKRWLSQLKRPSLWFTTVQQIFRFIKEIRSVNYDLIIDFQGLLKSGLLVFLCRGKRKVGYDKSRELSYLFLNERFPPEPLEKHALEKNLNLVKSLSGFADGEDILQGGNRSSIIAVGERERRTVEAFLKQEGIIDSKPLIVVNTTTRWETKLWDSPNFARLSDQLIDQYDAQIIFTGQKIDSPSIDEIMSLMRGQVVNASGKTTIKELAYLLQRAALVITTDSGPMHIAAAMGTPVVALFGPTSPWRTGPYSKNAATVKSQLSCSPCFKRTCKHCSCMKGISVEAVLSAVDRQLQSQEKTEDSCNC